MTTPRTFGKIDPASKRWVTLQHYCELTGESAGAVYARRRKGEWLDGVHTMMRKRRLWINLPETEKWLIFGKDSLLKRAR